MTTPTPWDSRTLRTRIENGDELVVQPSLPGSDFERLPANLFQVAGPVVAATAVDLIDERADATGRMLAAQTWVYNAATNANRFEFASAREIAADDDGLQLAITGEYTVSSQTRHLSERIDADEFRLMASHDGTGNSAADAIARTAVRQNVSNLTNHAPLQFLFARQRLAAGGDALLVGIASSSTTGLTAVKIKVLLI